MWTKTLELALDPGPALPFSVRSSSLQDKNIPREADKSQDNLNIDFKYDFECWVQYDFDAFPCAFQHGPSSDLNALERDFHWIINLQV